MAQRFTYYQQSTKPTPDGSGLLNLPGLAPHPWTCEDRVPAFRRESLNRVAADAAQQSSDFVPLDPSIFAKGYNRQEPCLPPLYRGPDRTYYQYQATPVTKDLLPLLPKVPFNQQYIPPFKRASNYPQVRTDIYTIPYSPPALSPPYNQQVLILSYQRGMYYEPETKIGDLNPPAPPVTPFDISYWGSRGTVPLRRQYVNPYYQEIASPIPAPPVVTNPFSISYWGSTGEVPLYRKPLPPQYQYLATPIPDITSLLSILITVPRRPPIRPVRTYYQESASPIPQLSAVTPPYAISYWGSTGELPLFKQKRFNFPQEKTEVIPDIFRLLNTPPPVFDNKYIIIPQRGIKTHYQETTQFIPTVATPVTPYDISYWGHQTPAPLYRKPQRFYQEKSEVFPIPSAVAIDPLDAIKWIAKSPDAPWRMRVQTFYQYTTDIPGILPTKIPDSPEFIPGKRKINPYYQESVSPIIIPPSSIAQWLSTEGNIPGRKVKTYVQELGAPPVPLLPPPPITDPMLIRAWDWQQPGPVGMPIKVTTYYQHIASPVVTGRVVFYQVTPLIYDMLDVTYVWIDSDRLKELL